MPAIGLCLIFWPVAQSAERPTHNRWVDGSFPSGPTSSIKDMKRYEIIAPGKAGMTLGSAEHIRSKDVVEAYCAAHDAPLVGVKFRELVEAVPGDPLVRIAELEEEIKSWKKLLDQALDYIEGSKPKAVKRIEHEDGVTVADLPLKAVDGLPVCLHEHVEKVVEWVGERLLNDRSTPMPCPVCRTLLKLYSRKLNSGMARAVMLLHKFHQADPEAEWLDLRSEKVSADVFRFFRHKELDKLPWWGLAVKCEERADAKRRKGGKWKLTQLGQDFAQNKAEVPRKFLDLLNRPIKPSAAKTSIVSALGDHFNFFDLMNAALDVFLSIAPKPKPKKVKKASLVKRESADPTDRESVSLGGANPPAGTISRP